MWMACVVSTAWRTGNWTCSTRRTPAHGHAPCAAIPCVPAPHPSSKSRKTRSRTACSDACDARTRMARSIVCSAIRGCPAPTQARDTPREAAGKPTTQRATSWRRSEYGRCVKRHSRSSSRHRWSNEMPCRHSHYLLRCSSTQTTTAVQKAPGSCEWRAGLSRTRLALHESRSPNCAWRPGWAHTAKSCIEAIGSRTCVAERARAARRSQAKAPRYRRS